MYETFQNTNALPKDNSLAEYGYKDHVSSQKSGKEDEKMNEWVESIRDV